MPAAVAHPMPTRAPRLSGADVEDDDVEVGEAELQDDVQDAVPGRLLGSAVGVLACSWLYT